ncbi:MAG: glycosyltransferase family 39 protein [Acidimicrobiales bacterium]
MTLVDPPTPIVLLPAAPAVEPVTRARPAPTRTVSRLLGAAIVGVTALATVVRFIGPRGLWLDEALTVDIARLPIPRLLEALRHDGAPPGYYVLLHYWMGVFGTSTEAVRALAAVISVATLPVAWWLGRAIGGRRVAAALVVVLACNPFALRYGTENRMYSLVMLLAALGALALVRCLQKPTLRRLFAFGLVCGLLLLTHYWALYLVGALGGLLAVFSLWGRMRTNARLSLVALAGGCLLFLPWAPSFVFQAQHTGTPWSTPASPSMVLWAFGEFAGWERAPGMVVFGLYITAVTVLAAAVILTTVASARGVAHFLGWHRPVPGGRWAAPVAGAFFVAMIGAIGGGMVASAAFAYRYASVVLPLIVVLVALGVVAIGRSKLGAVAASGVLLGIATFGTAAGASEIVAKRTEATLVAAAILRDARPGDLIAYCPDQLGPAVSRLLPTRLYNQVTFPRWDDPSRINWVDYAQVNAATNPAEFARELLNIAGQHQLWLVWEGGYRTLGPSCQEIRNTLRMARPDWSDPVRSQPRIYYEHENLARFLAE